MRRKPRLRVVVRFRAARSRLARFVGGSAAVHGALLVVVLIVPLTRHKTPRVEDAMVVALAGPIGGVAPPRSAPAPPAAPQPKPIAAPPPREAHTVRELPVPKTPEKPAKPKKDTPKPHEAAPAPTPPQESAPDATPDTPTGPANVGPGPPAAGAPSGVTAVVGGGDSALGWYNAAVKAALESAWEKPFLEDQGQTYSVVIAFDIARDGTTRNIRIVETSGIPSLDRSAQRAVMQASPLPAVPPTWKDDLLPATMRFNLNPETR
jgi:protein TonB